MLQDNTVALTLSEPLDFETQYYWRVKGTNEIGDGDWSETWSFTTTTAPPSQIALLSPENGADSVDLTPEFSWEETEAAQEYQLQLSLGSDFESVLADTTLSGTTFTPEDDLDVETIHFWRVRATNTGGAGEWSEVWSFTTIMGAPAQVALVSPENESEGIELQPELSWQSLMNAESYQLQLATDEAFSEVVIDSSGVGGSAALLAKASDLRAVRSGSKSDVKSSTTNETGDTDLVSFQVEQDLDYETTYFWRVRATNVGGTGEWSESWSFTTLEEPLPPGAFALLSPESETELIADPDDNTEVIITWEASENADTYTWFVIEQGGEFDTPVLSLASDDDGTATQLSLTVAAIVSALSEAGLNTESTLSLQWTVEAENEQGTQLADEPFTLLLTPPTSVNEEEIPTAFALSQNYPNPFNPTTNINYALPEAADVRLEIFNIMGQRVATLVNNQQNAGYHSVSFDASRLSSGMYISCTSTA